MSKKFTNEELRELVRRVQNSSPDVPTDIQHFDIIIRQSSSSEYKGWVVGYDVSATGESSNRVLKRLQTQLYYLNRDIHDGNKQLDKEEKDRMP